MRALGRQAEPSRVLLPALARRTPRRWRARLAADRYSRRVALLKRVLPAIGVSLLLLLAAWPRLGPLLESVRLGFAAIDLREARELKMLNPRYAGIDRLNRPYVVTAAVGRQIPNRDDLMSLERPRAEMTVHGGAKVVVTAATGIYQSHAQLLDLFDDVTVTHQNGTRFTTRRAHADFSDNTAEGHDPVEGHGPSGDIRAQGFRILDKGDTIVFTGQSHLVLKEARPGRTAAAPPALPAAIAATAAQLARAAAASPAAAPAAHRTAARAATPAHGRSTAKPHAAATPHVAKKHPGASPIGIARSHAARGGAKSSRSAHKAERDAG